MATKNISISEEAYKRLASLKLPHESFSMVISRLTGKRSLSDIFGLLSGKEANRLVRKFKKVRLERSEADKDRQNIQS